MTGAPGAARGRLRPPFLFAERALPHHRVSRFRGLPIRAVAPTQNCHGALDLPPSPSAPNCPAIEPTLARGLFAPSPLLRYRPAMPREGALTLSDVRGSTLTIACAPCARHGALRRRPPPRAARRRSPDRSARDAGRVPHGRVAGRVRPLRGRARGRIAASGLL